MAITDHLVSAPLFPLILGYPFVSAYIEEEQRHLLTGNYGSINQEKRLKLNFIDKILYFEIINQVQLKPFLQLMLEEFKKFITRGNVLDLAVGIMIGAAFNNIVKSLVDDIVMPPIGLLLKNINFRDLKSIIGGTAKAPVTINYGNFLQIVIEFLIIAFVIFLVVRTINSFRKKEEGGPSGPTGEEKLLTEIRDLLKERKI